ncbi:MAG: tetratricopeptide repeat protein [Candidatus Melainabacteria bacterium]|nr:tetratricopeptide repeat protein [Candidatus Melainabacteria bacterium]
MNRKSKCQVVPQLAVAFMLVFVWLGFTFGLDLVQELPVSAKTKGKDTATVEPSVNNFNEGEKKMKAGDVDGAVDSFLQAIYFARNNYYPQAYLNLGRCYMKKGEDAKALDALNKHVQQNVGPSPEAHCDLAEIYMRNDRDKEAEGELNAALIEYLGPGPRAHNLLGVLLEKRNDLKNAMYHFKEALGDRPWSYTDAWMNLAGNYMKQGEWSEAIPQFQEMLERASSLKGLDYEKVYLNMGTCALAKGNHQGAMDNWHQVLLRNPNNAPAHLYLGMLLDKENHIASAVNEYKAYLRAAPPNDAKVVAIVKDRVMELEQKIKPAEAEPTAAKPSPYMRKQMEDAVSRQRNAEEQRRRAMENLETATPKGDSGF